MPANKKNMNCDAEQQPNCSNVIKTYENRLTEKGGQNLISINGGWPSKINPLPKVVSQVNARYTVEDA